MGKSFPSEKEIGNRKSKSSLIKMVGGQFDGTRDFGNQRGGQTWCVHIKKRGKNDVKREKVGLSCLMSSK